MSPQTPRPAWTKSRIPAKPRERLASMAQSILFNLLKKPPHAREAVEPTTEDLEADGEPFPDPTGEVSEKVAVPPDHRPAPDEAARAELAHRMDLPRDEAVAEYSESLGSWTPPRGGEPGRAASWPSGEPLAGPSWTPSPTSRGPMGDRPPQAKLLPLAAAHDHERGNVMPP
jgi:hypothetical protein